MTQRLDALMVRESNSKAYFTKIGAAFPSKKGEGYTVVLDAIPAPVDGQYRIQLVVPKERDEQPQRGSHSSTRGNPRDDDLDDRIPF